ncbi:hypothetical protein C9374_003661 [Naegleria lovaniensis]|uniref:Peptidase S1 domain-containing protein n=1 Tax=Naegleria lovaniensis TaxID=51637 RepID=A0AA88H820_NAELO|nr:uncharacterized protein C9374_003661 [Naegleria lovaniensis]KAG2393897.1 hypothetical protein C9374_003661 [Naegleria lovaniensis]
MHHLTTRARQRENDTIILIFSVTTLMLLMCSLKTEMNFISCSSLIMGGELASIQNYPFMVSLQSQGRHFCGGSLLNSRVILTAAHCCFYDDLETPLDLSRIRAVFGQDDLRKCLDDSPSTSPPQEPPTSPPISIQPPVPPQIPIIPPISFPESNGEPSLAPPSQSSSHDSISTLLKKGKQNTSPSPCMEAEIERMQVHPSFSVTKMTNDLALLFLKEPLDLTSSANSKVNVIEMDQDWQDQQISASNISHWNANILEIVGYGRINGSFRRNYQLRKAQVNVTRSEFCNRSGLTIREPHHQFCVGDGNGISSCKGDSGGPLIAYSSEKNVQSSNRSRRMTPILIGVTSFGLANMCGNRTKRSVYTNILPYRSWIEQYLRAAMGEPPLPLLKNHGVSKKENHDMIMIAIVMIIVHLTTIFL